MQSLCNTVTHINIGLVLLEYSNISPMNLSLWMVPAQVKRRSFPIAGRWGVGAVLQNWLVHYVQKKK